MMTVLYAASVAAAAAAALTYLHVRYFTGASHSHSWSVVYRCC